LKTFSQVDQYLGVARRTLVLVMGGEVSKKSVNRSFEGLYN
jgi:hypothetical protein